MATRAWGREEFVHSSCLPYLQRAAKAAFTNLASDDIDDVEGRALPTDYLSGFVLGGNERIQIPLTDAMPPATAEDDRE